MAHRRGCILTRLEMHNSSPACQCMPRWSKLMRSVLSVRTEHFKWEFWRCNGWIPGMPMKYPSFAGDMKQSCTTSLRRHDTFMLGPVTSRFMSQVLKVVFTMTTCHASLNGDWPCDFFCYASVKKSLGKLLSNADISVCMLPNKSRGRVLSPDTTVDTWAARSMNVQRMCDSCTCVTRTLCV